MTKASVKNDEDVKCNLITNKLVKVPAQQRW